MDFSNIYDSVQAKVFNIAIVENNNPISFGSSFLIGDGTQMLTCSHCIQKTSNQSLCLKDGNKMIYDAITVAEDNTEHDFAILKLSHSLGQGLILEDSRTAKIGSEVFTIGFPYAYPATKSFTAGYVSALFKNSIRINSSVNNGNSGGPLFNSNGHVIGIVNAKMGCLSEKLKNFKNSKSNVAIKIGGFDTIEVFKQLISETEHNINLGIGYAISTEHLKALNSSISKLII